MMDEGAACCPEELFFRTQITKHKHLHVLLSLHLRVKATHDQEDTQRGACLTFRIPWGSAGRFVQRLEAPLIERGGSEEPLRARGAPAEGCKMAAPGLRPPWTCHESTDRRFVVLRSLLLKSSALLRLR
ncbi:hypothetical protein NDU88_007396 [Pleurodeles waltl]|uniref:Uncharacterized protein n=1 Tax=Pleurodeles waltl TaxID=8319 RepID=A0AAV7LZS3_PLEWA|nr:hypothetical protein NDU88_007396 [Pleurodeles waltl]